MTTKAQSHPHHHGNASDFINTEKGIQALKFSLWVLGLTAAAQTVVVWLTRSVALLADTIHNFSDALVALPLWFAFSISKRKPTQHYPYGYYRVEDLAGLGVLLAIFASGIWTGWESIQRIIDPEAPRNIALGIVAGFVGGLGNEIVARYRLKVGKEIRSLALMAEGHHARVDALTSLGVILGLGLVALGFPLADPIMGLIISAFIFSIVFEVGRDIIPRIVGKADADEVEEIRSAAKRIEGVGGVSGIKLQWLGHRCFADLCISVSPMISVSEAHRITEGVRHELLHHIAALVDVTIHADPYTEESPDPFHDLTAHHF
jgi:cation diffusion facilitator family transporter